jgi:acyl dehydratase
MNKGKTIHQMTIGEEATIEKTITEKDVVTFGHITQDFNPAHFDEEYAATTMFKKRIAHGMLVGSLFSPILGMTLPGPGAIYVHQSLKFTKPVYFGDTITAKVRVSNLDKDKNRASFSCEATNQKGETVIVGEAIMMPRKEA